MPRQQGSQPLGDSLGARNGQLRLFDRQLVSLPLLGAGKRLEQRQRRLQAVARGGLLGQVGPRDRFVELDDRLALLRPSRPA